MLRMLTATLLICSGGGVYGAGGKSQVEPEPDVRDVADEYFEALRTGDRQTLLSLFSGQGRQGIEAQLSDPAYTQFLIDRYRNARLETNDSGARGETRFVDITIWLNDTEYIKERLILKEAGDPNSRPLSIVARRVLNH